MRMSVWGIVLVSAAVCAAPAAAEQPNPAQTPVAEWGRLTGRYTALFQQGAFAEGTAVARQALALAQADFGADDARTAQVMNDLARLLHRQMQYAEALAWDQQALRIRERLTPPAPAALVQSLLNAADDLKSLQRPAEADALLARAIAVLEAELPADHPHLLDAVATLALLRMSQGQAAAAEPLFGRLEGQPQAWARLHPSKLGRVWRQHAACLRQLGRETEAQAVEQRAAALRAAPPGAPDGP